MHTLGVWPARMEEVIIVSNGQKNSGEKTGMHWNKLAQHLSLHS